MRDLTISGNPSRFGRRALRPREQKRDVRVGAGAEPLLAPDAPVIALGIDGAAEVVGHLERVVLLHRRVAGVVVEIAGVPVGACHGQFLLHQILVYVEQPAAGENLLKLILL